MFHSTGHGGIVEIIYLLNSPLVSNENRFYSGYRRRVTGRVNFLSFLKTFSVKPLTNSHIVLRKSKCQLEKLLGQQLTRTVITRIRTFSIVLQRHRGQQTNGSRASPIIPANLFHNTFFTILSEPD